MPLKPRASADEAVVPHLSPSVHDLTPLISALAVTTIPQRPMQVAWVVDGGLPLRQLGVDPMPRCWALTPYISIWQVGCSSGICSPLRDSKVVFLLVGEVENIFHRYSFPLCYPGFNTGLIALC